MRKFVWPKQYRNWMNSLPEQLGPRKLRLLVTAWCRELLEPRLKSATKKNARAAPILSAVVEATEASERFADTGKSKAALRECLRRLQRNKDDNAWPFFCAPAVMISLVSEVPEQTLHACGMSMQWVDGGGWWHDLIAMIRRSTPLDRFMPRLRAWVDDVSPPKTALAQIDPSCRTPEVIDVALSIYHDRRFDRMPELANFLEQAGCRSHPVLEHCRVTNTQHIRGCWVLDEVLGQLIAKPPQRTTGTRKRHQILHRELYETREKTFELLAQSEKKRQKRTAPGRPQQQFDREMQLNDVVMHAVLEHLGYGPIDDLETRLHAGVDRALDYFFDDWWRGDDYDSRALDKTRPDRELRWLSVLSHGLLLCGLTGRWDDATKLCAWVDSSIQLEYRFELNDYEYQWLYLCLASQLRPQPLEGVGEMLQALRECRPKRPRMLCAAWEAVLAQDQMAFDKALKESVKNFQSIHASDVPNVNFWVAQPESFIWLFAEKNDFVFPKLPEKLDAAIVRRQTIGLTSGESKASAVRQ